MRRFIHKRLFVELVKTTCAPLTGRPGASVVVVKGCQL